MEHRGLICVAVAAANGEEVLAAVTPVLDLVDVIEIRLDALTDPRIEPCIAALPKPVLVTNRPTWEGGAFRGSEQERLALLCRGLDAGARYADIELRAEPDSRSRILAAAHQSGAQVLISSHDFASTPSADQLSAVVAAMIESGADIGKIVTTASTPDDVLRVLALQREAMAARFRLCAFCMGAPGTISRLATLYLGGWMTYVALAPDQATAPGQLTAQAMHTLTTILDPA